MNDQFKFLLLNNTTSRSIAKKTSIPLARIEEILADIDQATPLEVRKIAQATGINVSLLVNQPGSTSDLRLLYRKKAFAGNTTLEVRLNQFINGVFEILGENKHITQRWNIPDFEQSPRGAFNLAEYFRTMYFERNNVEPIENLSELATENLGCIVLTTECGHDVDGASCIVEQVPFIFISPRFSGRMLFTLAHELGHVLAHHKSGDYSIIDKHLGITWSSKTEEEFANFFATNLLLPEKGVGIALKKIRNLLSLEGNAISDIEIIYLSRIFGVSFEVAGKRLEDLNLLPTGSTRSIYEVVVQKFGSPERRAEELNMPKREDLVFDVLPENVMSEATKKILSGELSLGHVAEILNIPINSILEYNALLNNEDNP